MKYHSEVRPNIHYFCKQHFFLLIYLVIWLFSSCSTDPTVRFLEPQPKNKKNLQTIPKAYQGKYIEEMEVAILSINSSSIVEKQEVELTIPTDSMTNYLDTVYLKDTTIINGNWTISIDREDDSTRIEAQLVDTLFRVSKTTKLRKHKGHLFLNYLQADATWKVMQLSLDKNLLTFNRLDIHIDMDTLKEITPVTIVVDTLDERPQYFDIAPTKKQLKVLTKRSALGSRYIKFN